MAKSMAQVEQRAAAAELLLVLADDQRLGAHAMDDRFAENLGISGQEPTAIALAPGEKIGVVDQSIFDYLGIARPQFPVW